MATTPGLLVRRWPERRVVVLGVASVLLAAGFMAVREASNDAFVIALAIPVVLVALELGLRGGLAAAAVAVALLVAAAVDGQLALATSSLVLVAVGAIAGRFSDRMRAAYERERRLLESSLALGTIADLRDLPAVAARAAARIPCADGAAVELVGSPTAAAGRAEGPGTSVAIVARNAALGHIRLVHAARLAPEERAALELLARQAALAADNQLLLEREREAALAEAELRRAREDLLEQRSGLGHLLQAQEHDRVRAAERLHEDLAQVLAAVLMGLRMLRRTSPGDVTVPLDELHDQVVDVLADVRNVAASLRPSSLAELGLVPALESLAERSRSERGCAIEIDAGDIPEPLPEPLRTTLYRMVEQSIGACPPGGHVTVSLHAAGERLEVVVGLPADEPATTVAATRARAGLLEGSAVVESATDGRTQLRVSVPLQR